MKARIKWIENRMFLGESESGHALVMGSGAASPCPSPMELVLLGTGGCSAFDVVNILERGREAITDCVVEMAAERAGEDPKVFTRVHMHFVVTGRGLNPAKVARAIELSADKYCSASAMIAKTATITHDFELAEAPV